MRWFCNYIVSRNSFTRLYRDSMERIFRMYVCHTSSFILSRICNCDNLVICLSVCHAYIFVPLVFSPVPMSHKANGDAVQAHVTYPGNLKHRGKSINPETRRASCGKYFPPFNNSLSLLSRFILLHICANSLL